MLVVRSPACHPGREGLAPFTEQQASRLLAYGAVRLQTQSLVLTIILLCTHM